MIKRIATVVAGVVATLLVFSGAEASGVVSRSTARTGDSRNTAAPHIQLSSVTGPPASTVTVSGSGFGAYQAVAVYFDATREALASSNDHGAFSGVRVTVPASARPGRHWVTGVEQHSGRSAQAAFQVNTDWAQFLASADHDGFNPYENVLSPSNVAGLTLAWKFHTGNSSDFSSLAEVNRVLYFGSGNGNVYALDAATRARLWKSLVAPGGTIAFSSPAVVNGMVYINTWDPAVLYALDAATGAKLWSFRFVPFGYSSPTVVNGVVYISAINGEVYALDAVTGAKLWSYDTKGTIYGSPAVDGGIVYIGSEPSYGRGDMYALDAATGALLWRTSTGSIGDASPAVANGRVFIDTQSGRVYALDTLTGHVLWRFSSGVSDIGSNSSSAPAVADGVVYVSTENNTDSYLYALDATTGAKLWSYHTGGGGNSSPAVANGVVYVGTSSALGTLVALDAATGARLWSDNDEYDVVTTPTVVNGMIYIGSGEGNIYAFGLPGGPKGRKGLGTS